MGQGDQGFVPSHRMLRVDAGDYESLLLPTALVARAELYVGKRVSLTDCCGRLFRCEVDRIDALFYLVDGWNKFIRSTGARPGDSLVFEFVTQRSYKVIVFRCDGIQKYPAQQELGNSAFDRTGCSWTQPRAQPMVAVTPLAAMLWQICWVAHLGGWAFNATDLCVDEETKVFVQKICCGIFPVVPVYLCQLRENDITGSFMIFKSDYNKKYVITLMTGLEHTVQLSTGRMKPTAAKMAKSYDGHVLLIQGWLEFVEASGLADGMRCIFQVDKFGSRFSVIVHVM
ncbi:hypothetical protein ACP70R_049051 [Stipagrostis hirtigluma subsp. patula]